MEKLNNLSVQISAVISYYFWWSGGFPGKQEEGLKLYPHHVDDHTTWCQSEATLAGTDIKCIHWVRLLQNILQVESI